ncbi:extracellular solute-binding protein [Acidovorax sp. SUPP2539]|uniref:ABC transporter substrate-binding protein n=1 Tax=Acidovorax sp. SUPP2539 TaxID=2920878 RepID=UPI0023DE209E|nr:extracellular solute-binding protein [Acidovorax sp. SUPP2539]GKS87752.1 extracellular solute-binding protein [Acidovorax sp. SUPP2539]
MTQRRQWLQAASALGATALLPGFAQAQSGAKKFQGVTLNVSTFSAAYPKLLQQYLPEFESLTGARVNFDAPSFPVYNQRADLELSTKGSAYDVVNVTFIYSSRWIHSGWLTPLDDFIRNPNLTPADWDVNDFLPGARAPETGKDGKLYGIPWTAEALLSASSRFDLVQQAGLAYPDTTDDLVKVLRAVNKKERVAGFVSDSHYGWTFVPYLHAFGGDVFRKAPDDLYPTLDTPEAIAAAEYYASLLREFGPDGAITYTPDQVTQALKLGRVNFTDAGQLHLAQLGDPASSKTLKTLQFGQVPKGPAGRFPGTAVHGLGIPTGSKNKEAAWAFIQWALSKQTTRKAVLAGYGSPARRSDIDSREFRARQVINGNDLAQLALDSIELASKTGHMKYRTVSVYPQVDQQLNKAIALIASGQASARQALQQAQAQSITELQRAGLKL